MKFWQTSFGVYDRAAVRREVGRIVRYGLVGAGTIVVFYASDISAVELVGVKPVAASLLAQAVTIGVAYYGHALISFQIEPQRSTFVRFVIITAITMAANWAGTELITGYLGQSYLASMIVVSLLVPVLSYFCNRFWVFMPGLVPQLAKARRID